MNAPIRAVSALEPRPLYGIGTVARLTGLKADTLRVWERRYGLGASHKSATGRRQYTQSDLDHLQLVAALVSQGVRIGEIAASDGKTLQMLLERHSQGSGHLGERCPPPSQRSCLLELNSAAGLMSIKGAYRVSPLCLPGCRSIKRLKS